MDMVQLRYFSTFSKTLNYSHTADEFYVSRQAVSKAIRSIESELGTKLVEKDGQHLKLTEAGKGFAKKCDAVIDELDRMVYEYTSHEKRSQLPSIDKPAINLSCSYSLFTSGVMNMIEVLGDFSKSSGLEVKLSQGTSKQCYERVMDNYSDGAMIISMQRRFPECHQDLLGTVEFAVIVSKDSPFATKKQIEVDDLKSMDMVLLSDYEFVYDRLISDCRVRGFELKPTHIIDEVSTALRTVVADDAVMITDVRKGRGWPDDVVLIPFADKHYFWCLYYVFRKDSPRASDMWEFSNFLRRCKLDGLNPLPR